jgi:hypothetical protein
MYAANSFALDMGVLGLLVFGDGGGRPNLPGVWISHGDRGGRGGCFGRGTRFSVWMSRGVSHTLLV